MVLINNFFIVLTGLVSICSLGNGKAVDLAKLMKEEAELMKKQLELMKQLESYQISEASKKDISTIRSEDEANVDAVDTAVPDIKPRNEDNDPAAKALKKDNSEVFPLPDTKEAREVSEDEAASTADREVKADTPADKPKKDIKVDVVPASDVPANKPKKDIKVDVVPTNKPNKDVPNSTVPDRANNDLIIDVLKNEANNDFNIDVPTSGNLDLGVPGSSAEVNIEIPVDRNLKVDNSLVEDNEGKEISPIKVDGDTLYFNLPLSSSPSQQFKLNIEKLLQGSRQRAQPSV